MNILQRSLFHFCMLLVGFFSLGGAAYANVSAVTASPGTATVNTNSSYTIGFTTGVTGALTTSDTITITFPSNTSATNFPLAQSLITVNGTVAGATGSSNVLTITVPAPIAISTPVTVIITSNATYHIINPSFPSASHRVDVHTSVEATDVQSSVYSINQSGTSLVVGTVSVTTPVINQTSAYSVDFETSADGQLIGGAGGSTIVLNFTSDTQIPATIAVANINILGTNVYSATCDVGNRRITLVPGTTIPGGQTGRTINILAAAGIHNPTTYSTNTYRLNIGTTAQPASNTAYYTIGYSGTAVTGGAVTVTPLIVCQWADYAFNINTSSDGALLAGNQIILTFPTGTILAASLSGVQVDNQPVTSATGSGTVLTITLAQPVAASHSTPIHIPSTSNNIRNSSASTSDHIHITTTVQTSTTANTSNNYTPIYSSTAVIVGTVTVAPATIGQWADYTFNITTSSDGALAAGNQIIVTFPAGTNLAASMTGVQVDNLAVTSATGAGSVLTITLAQTVAVSDTFPIHIPATSNNLRNPTSTTTDHIHVTTTAQTNASGNNSPNYNIDYSPNAITGGAVTVTPATISQWADYAFNINTSSDGALLAGNQIILTFPTGTVLAASLTGVQVDNLAVTSATSSGTVLTITLAQPVAASHSTPIHIPSTINNIRNPSSTTTDHIHITTTVQTSTTANTSNNYTIAVSGTTLVVGSVVPVPTTLNQSAEYTIHFTTSADGALLSGNQIIISFPAATNIHNGALSGSILIDGATGGHTASGNHAACTITITLGTALAANHPTTLLIPNDSNNIRNPNISDPYTLTVSTTVQTTAGTCIPAYTIGASTTAVTVNSASATPTVLGNYGAYAINFQTSPDGSLTGGSDQVIVTFPAGTLVPDNPTVGGVQVNGVAASAAAATSGNRRLTITLGAAGDIAANNNSVPIVIPSGIFRNPLFEATGVNGNTLTVSTSVQPVGYSPRYDTTRSTALVVNSVALGNYVVGNASSYSVSFNSNANGHLYNGESWILLTFPDDCLVTNGALVGVQVQTFGATAVGNSTNRTILITLPLYIAGGTSNIQVFVPNTAVRNPTSINTFALSVETMPQAAGTTNFTTIQSLTGVQSIAVAITPPTVGNRGDYSITFNTSSDGPLISGRSHITIVFPTDTFVNNGSLTGLEVQTVPVLTAIGSGNNTIDITVPTNVLGSTTGVTVTIPGAVIRNPTTLSPPTYTLTLGTTPQPARPSAAYSINKSSTLLVTTSVAPSPSTIGNQSAYTILFNTAPDGMLLAGISHILVTFPSDTVVNSTITGVRVNGNLATSATSSGQTIDIVPSTTINGSSPAVSITIPAANLRNPTTAGSYTVTVGTTPQPSQISASYVIGYSATQVAVTGVTTSPSTVGNPSAYTITFDTSSDGALIAGSYIHVTLPSDTIVNGIIAGVTINGTAATATSDVGNRRIHILVPTLAPAITGNFTVTVYIPASNITNPSLASTTYTLGVYTSVQINTGESPLYAIGKSSNTVSITSVAPSPSIVGNLADYTVIFQTSLDGAIQAATGAIILVFPVDTDIPDGALLNILVNGASTTATGINASRRITIVPSANINASSTVTVAIPLSVGVRNPTTTGTSFSMQVTTSSQPTGISPDYAITQSSTVISGITLTPPPNPDTVGSNADYSIQFTTGAMGPLFATSSHIIITFPDNTHVNSGPLSGIQINGADPLAATGSASPARIDLQLSAPISASSTITVTIPSTIIYNPSYAGSYTLTVSTTAQAAGTSAAYIISISSTNLAVSAANPTSTVVNTLSGYSVDFNPAVILRGNASSLFIQFPDNSVIPDGAISNVLVGGAAASATGEAVSRRITITVPATISVGSNTTITIPSVITNASQASSHALGVSTTAQPMGTANYTLTPSTTTCIGNVTVTLNPSLAGQLAQYTVSFTIGPDNPGVFTNRLAGGNIISVLFPAGTILPASIPAGSIMINSIPTIAGVTPAGQYLNITVPAGVDVSNSGLVTVVIDGITNPPRGVKQIMDVHTDVEPAPVASNFYTLTANTHINTPTISITPDSIWAPAEYTVTFSLGSEGSLDIGLGNYIRIVFPNSTHMPALVTANRITMNGNPVSSARFTLATNSYSIDIQPPIAISASAPDKTVTIIFATNFGITNPPLPGNYTITAATNIESVPVLSNPYAITPSTSTQVTAPVVSLYPNFIGSNGRYQINFTVGNFGALVRDISTISLTFPEGFVLPASLPIALIQFNGQALRTAPVISGQTLTLTTPIDIAISGPIEIRIPTAAAIQNPAIPGSYQLTAASSSEPTPVSSNALEIRRSTWADVVTYPNPMKYDASLNKAFTFLFIPDQAASLKLFTLDGRLVKSIEKNDTSGQIVWDLKNTKGSMIASGIYLYVIKGPSGEKRGKVALLK